MKTVTLYLKALPVLRSTLLRTVHTLQA